MLFERIERAIFLGFLGFSFSPFYRNRIVLLKIKGRGEGCM